MNEKNCSKLTLMYILSSFWEELTPKKISFKINWPLVDLIPRPLRPRLPLLPRLTPRSIATLIWRDFSSRFSCYWQHLHLKTDWRFKKNSWKLSHSLYLAVFTTLVSRVFCRRPVTLYRRRCSSRRRSSRPWLRCLFEIFSVNNVFFHALLKIVMGKSCSSI